jgi:MFS family permease
MFFFLTQFLRGVLGYSDLRTGFAFVPLTVSVFASSQLASRLLVDRIGDRRLMIGGATLSVVGMVGLAQLSAHSGYLALLLPLVIYGIGNGLAFVPLTTTALEDVTPDQAGAASGLVNVMQQVGGSLGLAVLVTLFGDAVGSGDASAPATFVHGADVAFRGALVFVVLTWLIVTVVIRRRPVRVPDDASALYEVEPVD